MKIEKIEFCNFRGIKEMSLNFSEKLNLFVGVNGSGKSTVLDGLATTLSWVTNRTQRENGRGRSIKDSDIYIGQPGAYLDLTVRAGKTSYHWSLTRSARGSSGMKSQLGGASELASRFRAELEEHSSYPVIAYYPVERIVNNNARGYFAASSYSEYDIYENALDSRANFHSFFEWFYTQDNIKNEQAVSRTNWMKQNRTMLKKRINKILRLMKNSFEKEVSDLRRLDHDFEYLIRRFQKDEILLEEPRFLFRELTELIHMIGRDSYKNYELDDIFHDLEYMFHKMGSLSSEHRDNLIETGGIHEKIVWKISEKFKRTSKNETPDKIVDFLWECFSFATSLSLWWLSDENRRKVNRLFSASHPLRNKERRVLCDHDSLPGTLNQIIEKDIRLKKHAYRGEGRELKTVKKAIKAFVPEYKNLEVKRVPRPQMVLKKKGNSLSINQLSDGEKNLIALIGDIAKKLTVANPDKKNPLAGKGVIMIDEIDLHLHPSWQRMIIPKLLKVFPNCQFFISTHSPQVISNAEPEDIFLLTQAEEGIESTKPDESYGMSIDRVVKLVMDDYSRPDKPREELERLFELIERGKLKEAKSIVCSMKEYMPSDPDLLRAEMLIRMEEKRG